MTDVNLKLLARESVLRFKNGSPKIKDELRKRCKERWKKNRENLVDKFRNLTEASDVQNTLASIIKEDLKTVYVCDNNNTVNNLNILNENNGEDEFIDEELEWLMSKYEDLFEDENFIMDMLDNLNEVMCPVCQKSSLFLKPTDRSNYLISCTCGLAVMSTCDLFQVKENITSCLNEHNSSCTVNPQFSFINDSGEGHVYLICYPCSCFLMLF